MDSTGSKASEQQPDGPSRRELLRFAALLAGSVGLQVLPQFSGIAAAADVRSFVSGQSGIDLDGQFVGFLRSIEGGFATGEVVQEKIGTAYFAKKHLAAVKYTDIAIQCEPAMPAALSTWVGASLAMPNQRKNGSIFTADFNGKETSRLDFQNALISEFTIPACDGSSKDPSYLTIKITPEFTKPSGGKAGALKQDIGSKQKAWLPSNFLLQIQGLEDACKHVTKIEAITIKQKVTEHATGEIRDFTKTPSAFEFSNLAIYLPEVYAGPFYQWFDDFVVKGNNVDDKEKAGVLDLLSADQKTSLLRLNFSHLGIFGFSPEKTQANTDKIRQVKVEMYCEQITLAPVKA